MRPYNDSIFALRKKYSDIFYEEHLQPFDNEEEDAIDSSKVYKVCYKINMLPMLSEFVRMDENGESVFENEGVNIIDECTETEELAIFESENF